MKSASLEPPKSQSEPTHRQSAACRRRVYSAHPSDASVCRCLQTLLQHNKQQQTALMPAHKPPQLDTCRQRIDESAKNAAAVAGGKTSSANQKKNKPTKERKRKKNTRAKSSHTSKKFLENFAKKLCLVVVWLGWVVVWLCGWVVV